MTAALAWRERAACRGASLEIFFPPQTCDPRVIESAKRICAGCEVSTQCLEWALHVEGERSYTYRSGIYGGVGPKERWKMQRCRRGVCGHSYHRQEAS